MLGVAETKIEKRDKVIQVILKISINIHIQNLEKKWYKLGDGCNENGIDCLSLLFCFSK